MFLQDTRIIAGHAAAAGTYRVLAQRCEVMFRCGQAIGLHPVTLDGHQQMFLRALHHEGLSWIIFDLRHLAAEIEADMLRLMPRDHPGVVFYSLRGLYPTRRAFEQAAQAAALAAWWPLQTSQPMAAAA